MKCVRIVAVVLVLFAAATVIAATYGASWLAVPQCEPKNVDAAFVLGGDSGDRVWLASKLYLDRLVPLFVLTGIEDSPEQTRSTYLNWRKTVLTDRGVPENVIILDQSSNNSRAEAAVGRRLAESHGWKKVIVISDPPHLRRLQSIWARTMAGSGISFCLVATRPEWWTEDNWWRNSRNAQFVIMEYIKLAHDAFSR